MMADTVCEVTLQYTVYIYDEFDSLEDRTSIELQENTVLLYCT